MVAAAGNITYGDAERIRIQKLAIGMGPTCPRSRARAKAIRSMHGVRPKHHGSELLPAAAALDKANSDELGRVWAQQKSDGRVLAMTIIAGSLWAWRCSRFRYSSRGACGAR